MTLVTRLGVALLTVLGLAPETWFDDYDYVPIAKVVRRCTEDKVVALTFDDGPYLYTNKAVEILNQNGAKGTFFVNGLNFGCIYDATSADALKNAYDHGHQVASHTWSHKDLTTLSDAQAEQEFSKVNEAIERITGARVAFTRPPYGNFNNATRQIAGNLGHTLVNWDLDSGDSTNKTLAEQKAQYDAVVSDQLNNALSLQHDVHKDSVYEVLPYAIAKLKGAGYKLVTVAECIGKDPYQNVGEPQKRSPSWQC